MAEADWTELSDGLNIATVDRGATAGIDAPPGGGDFVFAFNSLIEASGAVAFRVNGGGFDPMAKGGSIRGCVQRGAGGGATGFAPALFVCAAGPSVNDNAYLLGLSNDDPHRVVLAKGPIALAVDDYQGSYVQRAGDATKAQGEWAHLRLDAVVNDNGDVVINVYESDLDENPLSGVPDWKLIQGITQLVDDHLGINTGSQPYTSGRIGFCGRVTDVTRRMFFDHIEAFRQV